MNSLILDAQKTPVSKSILPFQFSRNTNHFRSSTEDLALAFMLEIRRQTRTNDTLGLFPSKQLKNGKKSVLPLSKSRIEVLNSWSHFTKCNIPQQLEKMISTFSGWENSWSDVFKSKYIELVNDKIAKIESCPRNGTTIRSRNPLPKSGIVSWKVQINRSDKSKGDSLGGGNFIGIINSKLKASSFESTVSRMIPHNSSYAMGIDDSHSRDFGRTQNGTHWENLFEWEDGCGFGFSDEIEIVADMNIRALTFYKNGKRMNSQIDSKYDLTFGNGLWYPSVSIFVSHSICLLDF